MDTDSTETPNTDINETREFENPSFTHEMPRATSYHYEPRKFSHDDWRNLKRLFLASFGIIVILGLIYLFAISFLSGIGTFWSIFGGHGDDTVEKLDHIPPPPPFVQTLPKAVNQDTIRITGFSEPGAKVTLFLNEAKIEEAVVDNEGGFTFEDVELFDGENRIYVQAKDQAENESKPSNAYIVVRDKKVPELVITTPADKATVTDPNIASVEVAGKTEVGIQITANDQWARVDEEGNFSCRVRLEKGENKIKVIARDEAGNETAQELTVTYAPLVD